MNLSSSLLIDIIFPNNRKTTIGAFYRPPNYDTKPLEDLKSALTNLSTPELVLMGDFNLSDIDWSIPRSLNDSVNYTLLMDIVKDNFLIQLVDTPTRDGNILDLVLASSSDIAYNLLVKEPFSDHNFITFTLNGRPYTKRKSLKLKYFYKNANWAQLKETLSFIPWQCAFLDDNIDRNWEAWTDLLFTVVDDYIPRRRANSMKNSPWITKELLELCRRKRSLYKKAKRLDKPGNWEVYKTFNNSLKKLCNSAKRDYY